MLLPHYQKMVVGEANQINIKFPALIDGKLDFRVQSPSQNVFASQQDSPVIVNQTPGGYNIVALKPGEANLQLSLWGYIPIKSIKIESIPTRRLVVGGHSLGVILQSKGIMVVGHAVINNELGKNVYPAREQGIEIGDSIMAVDAEPINNENDLARVIDEKMGQEVEITIKRNDKLLKVQIKPQYCQETNRYRIGLYVRDGVVGVGTLTFWDPENYNYAALGHIIIDADTRQGINVRKGKVVSASVQMIKPGKSGVPGEKIGIFQENGQISGDIRKNCFYGIYGKTDAVVTNPMENYPLEVGYGHQVKTGSAQIYTVISGDTIEKFEIEIEKVYPQRQNGKNMLIKVTDPRLINVSGGIVQGMSGSPIIQDNRIIGAVTHVLLNDPRTGYGVFMDYMLGEMLEKE